MRFFFLALLFVVSTAPLTRAQDAPVDKAANSDRVQLVEDDENGVLRIVIDGREVGRFDVNGLHVDGPVTSDNSLVLPREAIPDWNRRTEGGAP
jgi:hypothetical protein